MRPGRSHCGCWGLDVIDFNYELLCLCRPQSEPKLRFERLAEEVFRSLSERAGQRRKNARRQRGGDSFRRPLEIDDEGALEAGGVADLKMQLLREARSQG